MAIVYQHRRIDKNEVFYVGIGLTKNRAYVKRGRNSHWKSITKKTNYEIDILIEGCSWEDACEIEAGLISSYGRYDLNLGPLVNQTDGGEGNVNPSLEVRKKVGLKISQKKLGVPNIKLQGRKLSEETIEKIRKINIGKKYSTEVNNKKGKSGVLNPFYGKKHSEEAKEKNRLCHLGKAHSEETKQKIKEKLKGVKKGNQTKITCPYCGKIGGVSNIKRYHFNQCKFKNTK